MEDYRVTQTGDEIQEILNQSPLDTASIAELEERLSAVEGKIPSEASDENQLADKEYVDDSISDTADELTALINEKANAADVYTKSETYNKTELDSMITTPDVQYVSVTATAQTTAVTDVLPATGAADTIYRVGSWDGTQYDADSYSEYAWNGSAYVLLNVKNTGIATGSDFDNPTAAQRELLTTVGAVLDGCDAVPTAGSVKPVQSGGVFSAAIDNGVTNISEVNKSGSTLATYDSLSVAIAAVPAAYQRGGMSIKFIQTIPASYSVVKAEGVETAPASGTEVQESLAVGTGTYTADQLSGITLPSTVGTSVTYYLAVTEDETTTYTTWVIVYATAEGQEYVQYRLMSTVWSSSVADWQEYGEITIDDVYDSDLNISDENGNVLAIFNEGHFKVKNFDSSKDATPGKRGLMSAEDKTKLDTIEENAQVNDVDTNNTENGDLEFGDDADNIVMRVANGHIKTKNFDSSKIKSYKGYQRRISFVVNPNTVNFLATDFTIDTVDTIESWKPYVDNCVLYLPATYSPNGEPTKIIIFCKQGASTINLASDTILTDQTTGKIFRYLLYLGYGILAADGVPNGWAEELKLGERVVGNYVAVQSTIHAFNYVKEKYNIDSEQVFIFGYSQGGHYAQNVIDNSNLPIVAAAEVSPACSMRFHQWDLSASGTIDGVSYTKLARLNVARIFNFPAFTTNEELLALQYDPSKTIGYDPWNRNVENMYDGFVQGTTYGSQLWGLPQDTTLDDITMKKHIRCPLKIWVAQNDDALGVDVTKVFVKAIKNAGQVADLQLYSTGAHHIPSSQTPIGTFIENGQTVNLYPIAKDIAMWFYNFGGYNIK